MFILKKSSCSLLPMKLRTFVTLPRLKFHWEVLTATEIGKLWQNSNNSSALCMSNALDLFPGWSNIMTTLFLEIFLWCFSFDALFYTHQPFCMIEWWKTNICQYLNFPLVPHSISCFRILKNQKTFTNILQHYRFNVCFRDVLASVHGQQLHSLEASVKLFLWFIFTFWVKSFWTKFEITTHWLCPNL